MRGKQREVQEREADLERYRTGERAGACRDAEQRAQRGAAAAHAGAARLRAGAARGRGAWQPAARAVRHQATELTNSARAEVESTLEWARSQGALILNRAQQGAEQLLTAAGLGQEALAEVVDSIIRAATAAGEAHRPPLLPRDEPITHPSSRGPPPFRSRRRPAGRERTREITPSPRRLMGGHPGKHADHRPPSRLLDLRCLNGSGRDSPSKRAFSSRLRRWPRLPNCRGR